MNVRLRAVGIVKVLGGVRVLRGVDASFGRGRVHVIEGPNGSGKSTLLSILSGRLPPTGGRALLQIDEAARAEGRGLRDVVGWLGHDLGLYADLDAFANVALHARLRGLDPESAWTRHAEVLGIGSLRPRRVRELSRGQRQRVALARALMAGPEALLLDEPTTGLDLDAVARLAALLEGIAASSIVVAITHDTSFGDAVHGVRYRMAGGKLSAVAGAQGTA